MREFIIVGHTASLSHTFNLDDLAGSGGRMDVLCRCITSAFLTSHDLRTNVRVQIVLQDQYAIRFEGSELKRVNPDERSTGALFQNVLEHRHIAEHTGEEHESTPGIYISNRSLDDVLNQAQSRGSLVVLRETGSSLSAFSTPDHPIFILSDHKPFSSGETDLLNTKSTQQVCVSPIALHSHQTITIMHHYLDTNQYTDFCTTGE